MTRFQTPNKPHIRNMDDKLANALDSHESAINAISDQLNADPTGAQQASPATISRMSVTEADGFHDIQITDNAPAYRGINYFAYYSRTADFQNAHKIDMGASQNHRVYLGAGPYYWKADHAYPGSPPSTAVYHGGSTPQPVGSGTHVGPAMQSTQGTAAFGATTYRNSNTPPIRK
jgi:hypothetical protein